MIGHGSATIGHESAAIWHGSIASRHVPAASWHDSAASEHVLTERQWISTCCFIKNIATIASLL